MFLSRHLGLSDKDCDQNVFPVLGGSSFTQFLAHLDSHPTFGDEADHRPRLEHEVGQELASLAALNSCVLPMYGMGYSPAITPAVIRRNVLENPAWYTAYTPYQPEISQGRLEILMVFQTLIADMMGLPVANASMLDEATALGEAVALARRSVKTGSTVVIDSRVYPASIDVVRTRSQGLGINVEVHDDLSEAITDDVFCVVIAQLGLDGQLCLVEDSQRIATAAHDHGAFVVATSDLLGATLMTPPGAWGADMAVGSAGRFGIPLWYGGPGAGFLAVRDGLERQLPGRLVGESRDADGTVAYRLTLQTREQHIRREKATSNICTSQVLIAVAAAFYGLWHGPQGLKQIAQSIHHQACLIAEAAQQEGYRLESEDFFDTIVITPPDGAAEVAKKARRQGVGFRLRGEALVLNFHEASLGHTKILEEILGVRCAGDVDSQHLGDHNREDDYLLHPVFSSYHDETSMMRYMRALANKDYGLDTGMIPLGSCTMKLNPALGMEQISLPGFTQIHPYAPKEDAQGYTQMIEHLEERLCQLSGFDALSFQPNAGSQGEFAGLMAIRRYHLSRGEDRTICLIPTSAHGTNAASAALAGLKVVDVEVDDHGSVDLTDLHHKVESHGSDLAVMMVTYPSTHGVFETTIQQLCDLVHSVGAQVYIDGANFNALVGLTTLGELGADASHLNLHKTFAMPHGGGGPGVGPLGVKAHLADFLPGHELFSEATGAVSGAPYGSAGLLPITYAYLALMGDKGMKTATQRAITAANYVSGRLSQHFPTLYSGADGRVAHECILDLQDITAASGITVDDVAKRLIDYGFHAPTMSFPVPGTLMVEPTESESLAELDRFCDAMISIHAEIEAVTAKQWPSDDNPLVNAPHPAIRITGEWTHPYTRDEAFFPGGKHHGPILDGLRGKYWPPVGRIDSVYGDRNLKLRLS